MAENLCVPYQFYKHQMLKFAVLRFFMSRIKFESKTAILKYPRLKCLFGFVVR